MSAAPIRVAIAGIAGKMGTTLAETVEAADDLTLVCGIDPVMANVTVPVYTTITEALDAESFDVLVDFTRPDVVAATLAEALPRGIDCVVGTTGLDGDTLQRLAATAPEGVCLFVAPNFTIGAVLLMECARKCAAYFPDAEIIELHHNHKADAPSGTALRTAQLIAEARPHTSTSPGRETEAPGAEGARGALIDGVPVHSVRSDGFVASQEVIFGSLGQTLTMRHDSWDRSSYMPGVLLAIRSVPQRSGLIVGLEALMDGIQP